MAFLGMRGTGSWSAEFMPGNWAETVLYLEPNGDAQLTAIMSLLSKEKVTNVQFNWWEDSLPMERAAIVDIYKDINMTAGQEIDDTCDQGDIVYIKIDPTNTLTIMGLVHTDSIAQFKPGHQLLIREQLPTVDAPTNPGNWKHDINALVVSAVKTGSDVGRITVKLLQDVPTDVADPVDYSSGVVKIIGSAYPQGSMPPPAISYDPSLKYNNVQIWRSTFNMTRTAQRQVMRAGQSYENERKKCLLKHAREMEWGWLFGERSVGAGDNGEPLYTTGGIIPLLRGLGLYGNFADDVVAGTTWVAGGEDWLNQHLQYVTMFGGGEKLILCGNEFARSLQRLAKAGADITMTPRDTSYGLKVMEWISQAGTFYFKTHPLFNLEPTTRNMALILEPKYLHYMFIDDTFFQENMEVPGLDGDFDGFLTEAGIKVELPQLHRVLFGAGIDKP